jgi:hypothetical protein
VKGKDCIKLSPFWYALGMFVVAPFVAIVFIVTALLLMLVWPLVPFVAYFERKNDPVVDDINNRK